MTHGIHTAARGSDAQPQGTAPAPPTPSTPSAGTAISYPIKNLSSLKPADLVPFYADNGFTESVIKALVDNMVSGAVIADGVSDDDLVCLNCTVLCAYMAVPDICIRVWLWLSALRVYVCSSSQPVNSLTQASFQKDLGIDKVLQRKAILKAFQKFTGVMASCHSLVSRFVVNALLFWDTVGHVGVS